MGVRGIGELVAVLPPAAGDPARAVAAVREQLVECRIPDPDPDGGDPDGDLGAALAGVSAGFTVRVRQIRVVDAMLAHYARHMRVAELEAIAHRIVQELNPPTDKGAHE